VQIVGDIPIYVGGQSADVWAYQNLFELGKDGQPLLVSGVPPDAFSDTGQLWGTPLYDWKVGLLGTCACRFICTCSILCLCMFYSSCGSSLAEEVSCVMLAPKAFFAVQASCHDSLAVCALAPKRVTPAPMGRLLCMSGQAHKEDGFRWWVQRMSRCFQLHDVVRVDHFRGLAGASSRPSPPHSDQAQGDLDERPALPQ
jgi:hypothetical protein